MEYDLFDDAVITDGKIRLHDLVNVSLDTQKAFYNASLLRLLRETPSHVIKVLDGTSYPDFSSLIDALDLDLVGRVVIGARTDINDDVKATLDCTLILPEGVLRVQPHWCAYKEIRAGEIMTTMVRPLRRSGLLARTSIASKQGPWEDQPTLDGYSPDELASALFALGGYPVYSAEEIAKLAKLGNA